MLPVMANPAVRVEGRAERTGFLAWVYLLDLLEAKGRVSCFSTSMSGKVIEIAIRLSVAVSMSEQN